MRQLQVGARLFKYADECVGDVQVLRLRQFGSDPNGHRSSREVFLVEIELELLSTL